MASGDALPSWRGHRIGWHEHRRPDQKAFREQILHLYRRLDLASGGWRRVLSLCIWRWRHIGFAFVLGLVGVVPFILRFGGIIFVVILRLGGLRRILIGGGVATAGRVRHRKATAQTAPKVSKPLKNCPIIPSALSVKAYRSISPNTISIEPNTAETSASIWPRQRKSMACKCAKLGALILQR